MRNLASFLLFSITLTAFAQLNHPIDGPLYNKNSVGKLEIFIDPDSLAPMLQPANLYLDHEYPATLVYTNNGTTDTVQNIGFRLRGNTSRQAQKKSFKVSINSFTSGRRYQGVKDINMNGEHNDPSISRARLCWELGAESGIPVSRVAHAELYINGVYHGVYINLEHINDDWLGLRFGNSTGNLYKCTYPANLQYISNNPNDYKLIKSNGERIYELKTNESQDDYSGLANFIAVLNNTPLNQLECALDEVFNIEGYLHALAFEVATGHWDNYSFNQNNYYLYDNPETGKFEFIPYDMDNTFGVDWFGIDWANRNVNNWNNPNQNFPMANRLLAQPQLKEIYQFYLAEILQKLGSQTFENKIDNIHSQIQPYAYLDTFKGLDYGFSNLDFDNSFDSTQADQHVKMGIKTYINQRVSSGLQQLGTFNVAPIVRYLTVSVTGVVNQVHVSCQITDETACTAQVYYALNGGSLQSTTLYDDGQHGDGAAGDGWFGNFISASPGTISYQVTATDATSKTRIRPCYPASFAIPAAKDLVINELMADNDNIIADNNGDYSDWIELYNNSNDSIFLGDYYLTDDLSDPTQWQLPAVYLQPGDFQLIWASNNTSGGTWHASFALSKGGEEVGLFKQNGTGTDTADFILFGSQNTDESYGRSYDASPLWITFTTPTPDASNGAFGLLEVRLDRIEAFPNPYTESFVLNNPYPSTISVTLINLIGQSLFTATIAPHAQITVQDNFAPGMRVLLLNTGTAQKAIKLIKQ